jgi:hypothetical protein
MSLAGQRGGVDRDRLREALKQAASALKKGGARFALAGSYALWARGAPESEHDVDFAVPEEDTEQVAQILREAGFELTRPPEDWLFKVTVGGTTVDVLHRMAGAPVTAQTVERAEELEVLSIRMPVLDATDLVITKLNVLSEHHCDFGALLPSVRAVREQLDWARLRAETAGNDFAAAFCVLADRLGISGSADGSVGPA